jgi:fructose-1,6-bisphosphatase I
LAHIGKTVNQLIAREQRHFPGATGEFSQLLSEIIVAAKVIRDKITLAGIAEILGATGQENATGDTQKVLDILSNTIMKRRLLSSGLVCLVVSEEDAEPQLPKQQYAGGKYVVAMDPCDGSSNIACNVPVGTIFGIWERLSPRDQQAAKSDALQSGRKMICGGYVLYGPSSMLVYTTGSGVHGFTYDPSIGEFILTHENMKLPPISKCYSINEAYTYWWDDGVKAFVDWIKTPNKEDQRPYGGRYVGSLVSDVHRNLLYGGIYLYPKDKRSASGKLRLLYECAPLSYIVEQAGGLGSTGDGNVLDIVPTDIHERIPLIIGNQKDVLIAEEFIQGKRTK